MTHTRDGKTWTELLLDTSRIAACHRVTGYRNARARQGNPIAPLPLYVSEETASDALGDVLVQKATRAHFRYMPTTGIRKRVIGGVLAAQERCAIRGMAGGKALGGDTRPVLSMTDGAILRRMEKAKLAAHPEEDLEVIEEALAVVASLPGIYREALAIMRGHRPIPAGADIVGSKAHERWKRRQADVRQAVRLAVHEREA